MAYFALIAVIEAADVDEAHDLLSDDNPAMAPIMFVGEPWEVQPLRDENNLPPDDNPEFGTVEAVEQMPESFGADWRHGPMGEEPLTDHEQAMAAESKRERA